MFLTSGWDLFYQPAFVDCIVARVCTDDCIYDCIVFASAIQAREAPRRPRAPGEEDQESQERGQQHREGKASEVATVQDESAAIQARIGELVKKLAVDIGRTCCWASPPPSSTPFMKAN